MEIIYKKSDIASNIKIYYRKIKEMDVDVIIFNDGNIDETFKVVYNFNRDNGEGIEDFVPANKINEMIKTVLSSFGFEVYSLKSEFTNISSTPEQGYIPGFNKIVIKCNFAEELEINNEKSSTATLKSRI